tara:strand:- start:2453 stop:3229 length:777 start_codon:yes stop_codon:yes gene_type:complete
MNVFNSYFKISGLEPDSRWVYAFGGKFLEMSGEQSFHAKMNATKKDLVDSEFVLRLLRRMNIGSSEVFLTQQTHGDKVYFLTDDFVSSSEVSKIKADAIVTGIREKPIVVLTADCVPVILFDTKRNVVGIVHAGRRGTALRILSKTIRRMKDFYEGNSNNLWVGIGPAIGPCCYKVGGECEKEFQDNPEDWRRSTQASGDGKFFLDLIEVNRQQALQEGVSEENIFVSGQCTACENGLFYSYRKESTCGRNVSLVMLR